MIKVKGIFSQCQISFMVCCQQYCMSLRKHAYSDILKKLPQNSESFQIKISHISHISAQTINCEYLLEPPRRGGSNKYPQSMFLSRNKKKNVYLSKLQFFFSI